MSKIQQYIKENAGEIAYVTRSASGNWTISLTRKGNYTGRSISSYERLSDEDLRAIEDSGIKVFDFYGIRGVDNFRAALDDMERFAHTLCY